MVEQTRWAIWGNSGQICSAMSQPVVPRTRHGEVVDALVARAEALAIANGNDLASATWQADAAEAPFGGFERSGFGRAKGAAAVESYYQWEERGHHPDPRASAVPNRRILPVRGSRQSSSMARTVTRTEGAPALVSAAAAAASMANRSTSRPLGTTSMSMVAPGPVRTW